jgi:hypothetical protein
MKQGYSFDVGFYSDGEGESMYRITVQSLNDDIEMSDVKELAKQLAEFLKSTGGVDVIPTKVLYANNK